MGNGHGILRSYRKSRGLKPSEFARQLGISESTLRSYENGTRRITPEKAREFEERTEGGLTRRKLLPVVFGKLTETHVA